MGNQQPMLDWSIRLQIGLSFIQQKPSNRSICMETFNVEFQDGFVGMEIRNRRATKHGCMVRKFHLNKDGNVGQAQATNIIKRYMPLLSVNGIDLTCKPFQECLELIKSASRPMTIQFGSKIDKRDLPSGAFRSALRRNKLLSGKNSMLGLAKQLKTSAQNQVGEGGLSGQTKCIHSREKHGTKIKERGTRLQTLRNENTIDSIDDMLAVDKDDWVGLVISRKRFFNEQAKNLENEMLIRLCHICSKVDRFTSALHRFLHRMCSKCGHEFGDFIPKTVLDTAAFGKAAPVTSPQKHLNKRSNMELEVLAATYGIARYPPGTIDVTEGIRNIINESSQKMLL